MKIALPATSVAALEARTEGWVAGLQLAALSLQGRTDSSAFIDDFAGSHRFVLDYLAEEVLQRQSETTREFMLHTAILDRLHGPLCDAVTQQSNGYSLLQSFERNNLFVVPLDEQQQWFRYHHLFRDVLIARLQQHTTLQPVLHTRASDWFANNGYPSEAVQHLLAAKDKDGAAELIERVWPELRTSAPESTLIAWAERLPDARILCRPVLSVHVGLSYLSSDLERSSFFSKQSSGGCSGQRTAITETALRSVTPMHCRRFPGC